MKVSFNFEGETEILDPELHKYKDAFMDCLDGMQQCTATMHTPEFQTMEGWKEDYSTDAIKIYYQDRKNGRYFAAKTTMPLTVAEYVDENWTGVNTAVEWNDSFKFCTKYKQLSEHCDIAHYGTNKKMVVDGREFVCARMLHFFPDGEAIISAKSTKVEELKEGNYGIRAILHMGAARFLPHPTDPTSCVYEYIVCMDLKGMLFKSVLNTVMGRLVHDDVDNNRKRALYLREKKDGGEK